MHRRDYEKHSGDSLNVTFGSEQMEKCFPENRQTDENSSKWKKNKKIKRYITVRWQLAVQLELIIWGAIDEDKILKYGTVM